MTGPNTETPIPVVNRDISWLSFNYRVLQEAKDPSVPLFERLKFLAIYSSNLNEFFRVRVAWLRNLVRVGRKTKREIDFDPKKVLKEILKIVDRHQDEFSLIFENQIVPELRNHNIYLLRRLDLNEEQKEFVESYFHDHMLPFVQPVLLVKYKIRPFLNNAQLYMSIWLKDKEEPNGEDTYAIVKIPSDHLPRVIELPPATPERHDLIILDDIVRHSISWMFPGYDIIDTYSIKLTRDAELYIDDEFSGDLIQKIKTSLTKRHVGPASRFVYDREMPANLMEFLKESFGLDKYDLLVEGRYHNNFDFFRFPDFGLNHLKNPPLPQLKLKGLEDAWNLMDAVKDRDYLIHPPYHSFESVIRFFESAARDPKVTHIKLTQYRVARKSRIMTALKEAVRAGKQVFVFIEVKARFDEEANLEWGEEMERVGVRVRYSFPGVKVHAKMGLVRREEAQGPMLYAYLSTGNFHEDTAKIYSDFGLFTTDKRLTGEVARLFSFLDNLQVPAQKFENLLVGQFNLRNKLIDLINQEIRNAKAGKEASMILKLNSIQDPVMIGKLYEASRAGVKIRMIVRGICCLIPEKPGFSENITAISIVDRFLEHSRVFIFHNDGDEKVYLSSADWMIRNLSYRIETAFPVFDPQLAATIKDLIHIQLADNVKARIIDAEQNNRYRDMEEREFRSHRILGKKGRIRQLIAALVEFERGLIQSS